MKKRFPYFKITNSSAGIVVRLHVSKTLAFRPIRAYDSICRAEQIVDQIRNQLETGNGLQLRTTPNGFCQFVLLSAHNRPLAKSNLFRAPLVRRYRTLLRNLSPAPVFDLRPNRRVASHCDLFT